jgi:hypothetical protein
MKLMLSLQKARRISTEYVNGDGIDFSFDISNDKATKLIDLFLNFLW